MVDRPALVARRAGGATMRGAPSCNGTPMGKASARSAAGEWNCPPTCPRANVPAQTGIKANNMRNAFFMLANIFPPAPLRHFKIARRRIAWSYPSHTPA